MHSANTNGTITSLRNGVIRIRESGNTVTNTVTNGAAAEIFLNGILRSDRGTTTFSGNISTGEGGN